MNQIPIVQQSPILSNLIPFLDRIFFKLAEKQIDVSLLEMDHIGYQTSSTDDYNKLVEEFKTEATMVDEKVVGGRRVGVFELSEPITYHERKFEYIEIVEPKQGQICNSALEHVEFVISESFESFSDRYPNLDWDKSKFEQPVFPMLTLKLDDDIQVKFHYKPLKQILEENR